MALRSLSIPASLAYRLTLYHLPPPFCRPVPLLFSHRSSAHLLPAALSSSCRFHTSSVTCSVLSPPSASQSDPDPTLLAPLSHEEAPTLKEALEPALWFADAEPSPAPPTASETAAAADSNSTTTDGATSTSDSSDGSAETGGLYYTTSHPQLHPIAPIAEAVAPLPCAYTPPDIAPLMDVEDIKKAMESVIVKEDDEEEERRKKAEQDKGKAVEVKGLDELLEDVKADEEDLKKGKALTVSA